MSERDILPPSLDVEKSDAQVLPTRTFITKLRETLSPENILQNLSKLRSALKRTMMILLYAEGNFSNGYSFAGAIVGGATGAGLESLIGPSIIPFLLTVALVPIGFSIGKILGHEEDKRLGLDRTDKRFRVL